ncbi:Protein atp6v1fnb [Schistosoma haematobium]|uniref:Protein atp6v1fnb n=1 Tax=Schistosoma haematobium TaxID=6185 RepID=A0A922LLK4_SCHHA|nr:Protein atp6v1fnb [Schistosoma haematobium]KAH9588526.1 Protein atp6v1fnb [Schistosoma haematobium]CAH8566292.1 unnamed protein product [Schistosoma haematobium]CAH8572397.1 unnamed protein product [Schistosoma haematobium]
MSRSYPADTRSQKVLEELYEKETISQLNWFLKCQEAKKLDDSISLTTSSMMDRSVPNMSTILSKLNIKDNEEDHMKESNEIVSNDDDNNNNKVIEEENKQELTIGPDMFKPSPEVLKLLYEGISKEGKGRNLYLHDRYKLNLEDKFQFPVLSSMEYGWGHADLISKSTAQSRKFGRQCVIEDSFYRRTGIPFKHGAGMIGLDKYSF